MASGENVMRIDIQANVIDDNHWLLAGYDLDSGRLVQLNPVIEPTAPKNNAHRRYEIVGDMTLRELVAHHFPEYQRGGVGFLFTTDTGGIIDCVPLETTGTQSAGAAA